MVWSGGLESDWNGVTGNAQKHSKSVLFQEVLKVDILIGIVLSWGIMFKYSPNFVVTHLISPTLIMWYELGKGCGSNFWLVKIIVWCASCAHLKDLVGHLFCLWVFQLVTVNNLETIPINLKQSPVRLSSCWYKGFLISLAPRSCSVQRGLWVCLNVC